MRAFIIRPFGVKGGIDFDRVERDLIDPALAGLGITGRTTGEILKQGNIRYDMFQRLLTADLVVADLSIHNANAFYELGIRHALRGKGTFLLRSNQDAYPFDLQTDRYFEYDKDDPAASVPALTAALRQSVASEARDSPVFQLLPSLREQDRSQFLAVPRTFTEEVDLAQANRQLGDLGMLAAEAAGFEWESEGLRVVGRAQFQLKDYEGGHFTWESIRRIDSLDLEANTVLGTIYQRLGDLLRSDQALKRALDRRGLEDAQRVEIYALLARNAKVRWKDDWIRTSAEKAGETLEARRERALRSPYLEDAYNSYARGFGIDLNHFYSGLNALAMLSVLVELARALPEVWSERFERERDAASDLDERQESREKLAAAVELSLAAAQGRLDREGKTDIWCQISPADLSLLTSKRPSRVADAYRKALAGAPDFARDAALAQLEIYKGLEILTPNVQAALAALAAVEAAGPAPAGGGKPAAEPPRVLLFTGHMIDAPGRPRPRFPAGKADIAKQAIQQAVEAEHGRPGGVAYGIAGGASGGDIFFHEICAGLGIPTRLYLALPKGRYIQESVQPAGGDWVERFDRLTDKLPVRVLADSMELPSWLAEKPDYGVWQRNNLWTLHNALAPGGENVTLIALWNGEEGDGPGGTGDLVSRAKERGARVLILDTTKLFS